MDVGDWLRGLGLEQYEALFRESDIDPEVLPELTDQHLKDLGVSFGHRLKMLRAIREMARDAPVKAQPSPPAGPKPQDAAERRQLTVMFCDLVGSTAMSARLDPEEMRGIIGAYHRCCSELIERNGGFVAKYMGDGVLAYFGYPQAHEHDAERAVQAGLAIVEAAPKLVTLAGSPLHVRVGIATGLVVVGDLIGSGEAKERGVVGETPNLAARLQAIADPDTVVIAEGTRKLLGNIFELQDLGAKDLKGIAMPARAWAALRPSSAESRFEALHTAALNALVGRDEEYELLLRRWAKATAGEGQVALVSGEPGIGKSHLTAALQDRLRGEPHIRVRHFCSLLHRDSALYPFIAQLERAGGFERGDEAAARLDKLEALLAKSGEVNAARAGPLADLLGLAAESRYPPSPLDDPQRRRETTLTALIEEFARLARQTPVLLIFEDAHWADSSSLELLDRIVECVSRLPALLIVTSRPEFSPPWVGQPHVSLLSLNRLTQRGTAALIDGVTGGKSLPPEILDRIVERTDGVPLFVEELTKNLLEGGLLREEAEGYALAGPLPPLAIPSSLQDSLMARLDRLAGAKPVAQMAAIIGREFSYPLLLTVASLSEAELRGALKQLVDAELIFQRGDSHSAHYTFKHALIQEAAYQSLLKASRRVHHRRVAEAVERQFPETVETQPELLAYHCTEAGLAEPAIAYWRMAGQRAAKRAANLEAINHLQRGLTLLETLPDRTKHAEEELGLLLALGPAVVSSQTREHFDLSEIYGRARQLARETSKTAELFTTVWGSWYAANIDGNREVALSCTAELFRIGKSQNDPGYLLQAHHCACGMDWTIGNIKSAREHVEAGLSLYSKEAHRDHAVLYGGHDPAVCLYSVDALVLSVLGHPDRALAQHERGLALSRELAHPPSLVLALALGLDACFLRRDLARIVTLADELLLPMFSEVANLWMVTNAMMTRGWARLMLGESEAALAELRDGLDRWQATGIPHFGTVRLGRAAAVFIEVGELAEAGALLTEAFQLMERVNERWYEAELHRLQGLLLSTNSPLRLDDAEASFEKALAIARSLGARLFELRAAMSMARLWRDQGKREEARELLAPTYGWFIEGFDTLDLREAKALLDALAP